MTGWYIEKYNQTLLTHAAIIICREFINKTGMSMCMPLILMAYWSAVQKCCTVDILLKLLG